ncbi:MAG: riboflavin synthase [Oligoflexales bacterium]
MFTGIIENNFRVAKITPSSTGLVLTLKAANDFSTKLGDSVAINGCCLTVTSNKDGEISFDVSSESLAKTNLGSLQAGDSVNVERAMKLSDRLDGHIVQGHVEGPAELISIEDEGQFRAFAVKVPQRFAKYLIPKGSITLDGVSLTVNSINDKPDFTLVNIMLVPTTLSNTTFGNLSAGWKFNLETDLIGRYVERITALQK